MDTNVPLALNGGVAAGSEVSLNDDPKAATYTTMKEN
jgi:hypothetical protein